VGFQGGGNCRRLETGAVDDQPRAAAQRMSYAETLIHRKRLASDTPSIRTRGFLPEREAVRDDSAA